MVSVRIFPSIIQAGLTGLLQCAALLALSGSAAPAAVRLLLAVLVAWQMLSPLLARYSQSPWLPVPVSGDCRLLDLGAGFCRLRGGAEGCTELELPQVRYCSELLIVLRFRQRGGAVGRRHLHLMVWPDSLASRDNWRLRRYLETLGHVSFRPG